MTRHLDGWTTDDLIFQWKHSNPVQVAPKMHLPRFMLEHYEADTCDSVTNTGKWHNNYPAYTHQSDNI